MFAFQSKKKHVLKKKQKFKENTFLLKKINREKNHLLEAMQLIVKTGVGPKKQIPSSGCSIKWK